MTIEYSLTNKCNLNCAGCLTYSPLVKEDNSRSLKEIEKDFEKLYKLRKKVNRIIITGGEPLLYKNINKALTYIATLFKDIEIGIFTNATLLLQMNDEFFDVLRTYNVRLYPSIYPINTDYESIFTLLDEKEINYVKWANDWVKDGKRSFFHQYLKREYDKNYKSTRVCDYGHGLSHVRILKDNKLYPCNQIAYFDYFDKEFNGHNLKVTKEDYIDLDEINSIEELEEAEKRIPHFCGNCKGNKKDTTDWKVSKKDINEWLDDK